LLFPLFFGLFKLNALLAYLLESSFFNLLDLANLPLVEHFEPFLVLPLGSLFSLLLLRFSLLLLFLLSALLSYLQLLSLEETLSLLSSFSLCLFLFFSLSLTLLFLLLGFPCRCLLFRFL
jgi:hypothetical protein